MKFRLKTTQLEIRLNSCPGLDLIGGNCPGVVLQGEMFRINCLRGKSLGGKCQGRNYPGRQIVQGQKSGG